MILARWRVRPYGAGTTEQTMSTMKRVNMGKPVTVFGKQQGPKTLGQVVAEALAGYPNHESPQKVMSICTRLHSIGHVDLHDPDRAFLRKALLAHPHLVAAAVAAALDAIDGATELPTTGH